MTLLRRKTSPPTIRRTTENVKFIVHVPSAQNRKPIQRTPTMRGTRTLKIRFETLITVFALTGTPKTGNGKNKIPTLSLKVVPIEFETLIELKLSDTIQTEIPLIKAIPSGKTPVKVPISQIKILSSVPEPTVLSLLIEIGFWSTFLTLSA